MVFLAKDDREQLNECYNRFVDKTHGLIQLSDYALEAMFSDPALKIVGYRENGQIRGYLDSVNLLFSTAARPLCLTTF